MRKGKAVLVTTAHRGVFFGYATETDGATIKLRAARNCIYWPAEQKGFLGLASNGPLKGAPNLASKTLPAFAFADSAGGSASPVARRTTSNAV